MNPKNMLRNKQTAMKAQKAKSKTVPTFKQERLRHKTAKNMAKERKLAGAGPKERMYNRKMQTIDTMTGAVSTTAVAKNAMPQNNATQIINSDGNYQPEKGDGNIG